MKTRIFIIGITSVLTIIFILIIEYFIFGLDSKPKKVLSVDSPNGIYYAYVIENPSLDPPNQSLFVAKKGKNKFRMIDKLPEDIETVKKIYWSPNGETVVFITNWYLIITNIENFNSKKISLNPDWWKWHKKKKTFATSNSIITIEKLEFIGADSLNFRTNSMAHAEKICISDF